MADEQAAPEALVPTAKSLETPLPTKTNSGEAVASTVIPVVGIGSSAGGLDALKRFFDSMPPHSGMAFVLVPHLDPIHKSHLAHLLSQHTPMPVIPVTDRTVVAANHVYVISPNEYVTIDDGELHLSRPLESGYAASVIDRLLAGMTKGLLLVTFEDEPPPLEPVDTGTETAHVRQVGVDLRTTRECLQATIEELETANEELKATNEETRSTNTAVQSTNTELEASRQELEVLNEQLSTANGQLRDNVHELQIANDDLVNLLHSTDVATLILDCDLNIRRFTPSAGRLLSVTIAQIGRTVRSLAHELVNSELVQQARSVVHELTSQERQVSTADGRYFIRRVLPYRTLDGRVDGVVVTFTDVTRLKQTKKALRRLNEELEQRVAARTAELEVANQQLGDSRERLRAIVENATDAIITIDTRGIMDSVNPAAERMFDYTAAEMIGQDVALLMPAPYRAEHTGYLANYLQTGIRRMIGIGREVQGRRKDGSIFPLDLGVSEVPRLGLFTGVLRDVTQRKQLEREVLEIAALEQRRIGQELHDDVGQEVTGLALMADVLARRLEHLPAEAEVVGKLAAGMERVHRQVRRLARGLLPDDVDPEGLRVALEDLAAHTGELSDVTCTFECVGAVDVPDATTATHLLRVAQEAVNNSLRHGQARQIHLSLRGENDSLVLQIRDDGVGIPARLDEKKGGGVGQRIMRNRAAVIGGALTIGRAEGSGTQVTCVLPRSKHHG